VAEVKIRYGVILGRKRQWIAVVAPLPINACSWCHGSGQDPYELCLRCAGTGLDDPNLVLAGL
jgi:DnaJ-class molecular chaperone